MHAERNRAGGTFIFYLAKLHFNPGGFMPFQSFCCLNDFRLGYRKNNSRYLFLWSWAGGILRILQSDWFREQAVFSSLLTTVMVTNYTKRRVKLQIERAKFQFVLIIFSNRAVLLFNFLIKKTMDSDQSYHSDVICWHVDETMCTIKTWLFQFFLVVSPTF